jgi:hypothetical protein
MQFPLTEADLALQDWCNAKYEHVNHPPMSDETKQRLRFRHNYKSFEQYNLSEASRYAFSLYQKLIPAEVASKLHWLLSQHLEGTYESLADLSLIYRKYQTALDSNWYYFVDLMTLTDYVQAGSDQQVLDAVNEWIKGDMEHDFDDGGFDELFEEGCDVFLSSGSQREPAYHLSVEEFLKDPMYWATTGSSDGKRLPIKVDGVDYKARKSKWATACASTYTELLDVFNSDNPQTNKAVTKRELAKARMIIAGDMPNYLRMAYISEWLESKLSNHPNTTLFFSKKQMLRLWTDMIDRVTEGKLISIPIDESKYDHYVTKKMIRIMFRAIRKYITLWNPPNSSELLDALQKTEDSMFHPRANVWVMLKGHRGWYMKLVDWEKGLLSGWRWTALLNTIANVAKMYAYRKKMMLRLELFNDLGDPIRYDVAQGDDIDAAATNVEQANALLGMYTETGFILNPKKLFMSNVSDEYLRQLATPNRLQGYPARGIASLCFRNPITQEAKVGEDRLRELAANWLMCGRRCHTPIAITESLMIRDLANANGISKEDVRKYIHAPATYGGLGLEPLNAYRVTLVKSRIITALPTVQTPPLAEQFPAWARSTIVSTWLSGVEYGPKFKPKYSRFSITFNLEKPPDLWKISPVYPSFTSRFEPRVRPDVSPSLVAAYKEKVSKARMQEITDDADAWLTAESIEMLKSLKARSSIAFIKDWLTGNLPFHTPEDWYQGSFLTAPVYSEARETGMAMIATSANITLNLVRKVAFACEHGTKRYIRASKYVYTN